MSSLQEIYRRYASNSAFTSVIQFIKFGIVGVGNTLISTSIYYAFIFVNPALYMLGSVVGWVVSVFNSFYWNNRYVFKNSRFPWIKRLLRTYCAYGGSLLLGSVLLYIMVSWLHVSEWLAPWLNITISVPMNFLLNKFWAFKSYGTGAKGKKKDAV